MCAGRPQRGDSAPAQPACLSSGSEGPGEGTVQPLPTQQQSGDVQARRGLWELQEQVQGSLGLGRLPGGEPRAAKGMDAASLCPTLLPDPVDEVGGTFGAQSAHP